MGQLRMPRSTYPGYTPGMPPLSPLVALQPTAPYAAPTPPPRELSPLLPKLPPSPPPPPPPAPSYTYYRTTYIVQPQAEVVAPTAAPEAPPRITLDDIAVAAMEIWTTKQTDPDAAERMRLGLIQRLMLAGMSKGDATDLVALALSQVESKMKKEETKAPVAEEKSILPIILGIALLVGSG
jgi:uncharacterized protein YoaH (UPF0181 family)